MAFVKYVLLVFVACVAAFVMGYRTAKANQPFPHIVPNPDFVVMT